MDLSFRRMFALLMRPIDMVTRRHRIVAHLKRVDSRLLELEERTARSEAENRRLERMQLVASDFYERRLDLIYRNVSLLHGGESAERPGHEVAGRQG